MQIFLHCSPPKTLQHVTQPEWWKRRSNADWLKSGPQQEREWQRPSPQMGEMQLWTLFIVFNNWFQFGSLYVINSVFSTFGKDRWQYKQAWPIDWLSVTLPCDRQQCQYYLTVALFFKKKKLSKRYNIKIRDNMKYSPTSCGANKSEWIWLCCEKHKRVFWSYHSDLHLTKIKHGSFFSCQSLIKIVRCSALTFLTQGKGSLLQRL